MGEKGECREALVLNVLDSGFNPRALPGVLLEHRTRSQPLASRVMASLKIRHE